MTENSPLVQEQNCRGNWSEPKLLSECYYGGTPVELTDDGMDDLLAGKRVRIGSDWYDNLRLAQPKRITVQEIAPRFTCPNCGGHRDTTISGRCDDCAN